MKNGKLIRAEESERLKDNVIYVYFTSYYYSNKFYNPVNVMTGKEIKDMIDKMSEKDWFNMYKHMSFIAKSYLTNRELELAYYNSEFNFKY